MGAFIFNKYLFVIIGDLYNGHIDRSFKSCK